MSEGKKPDLDFIIRALNLIPLSGGAFNPNDISQIAYTNIGATIFFKNGRPVELTHDQLAELEATIKRLTEEGRTRRVETIRDEMIAQADARLEVLHSQVDRARQKEAIQEDMRMEAEVVNEVRGGIQGVIGAPIPTGKRFRPQ